MLFEHFCFRLPSAADREVGAHGEAGAHAVGAAPCAEAGAVADDASAEAGAVADGGSTNAEAEGEEVVARRLPAAAVAARRRPVPDRRTVRSLRG